MLQINNFKVRLYDCINEHDIGEISLEEFEDTQKIDESKIICQYCGNMNKCNSDNKSFFRCNSCKMNLCPICKNRHKNNHYIINYEDKNFICQNHNYPYSSYCLSCKKNICKSCEIEHKTHEILLFEKIDQNEDKLKNVSNNLKIIRDKIVDDIKDMIKRFNKVMDCVDALFKINDDIIKNKYKYKNYEILQNMNFNFDFKILDDYKKEENIYNKFKKIMNIYEQIVEIDDELRIIYRIRGARKKIKIFNSDFVQAFKNKLKISYQNKENKLKDEFEIKKIKKDKFEIKLKGLKKINNPNELNGMLFGCDSFFSLPSVSRWNKNNNINEDDLFKSNNINNKKNNNKLNNKLKITLTIISAKCGNGTGKTSLITRFLYNVFHDEITNH